MARPGVWVDDPGFVEFPVWLIITQETLKAEYRHYPAKLLVDGYKQKIL